MSLKAIWSQNTPYSKFLLSVGVILVSAVFFTMLCLVAAAAMYGVPLEQLQEVLARPSDPQALAILKFVQVAYTFSSFMLPAFFLAWMFDPNPYRYLGLSRRASAGSLLIVACLILAALPLINFLGDVNSRMALPAFLSGLENWMKELEQQASQMLESFLDMKGPGDLLFNLFMIGLLPAIAEEMLFRGIVQRLFLDLMRNKHAAVWITAILFSAIHMQFYGFLPRMMLGVMLGYLYIWSGSLWLPICAHFTNNAATLLLTWFYREKMIGVNADTIGTQNDFGWLLASILLTVLLLVVVWRRENARLCPPAPEGGV